MVLRLLRRVGGRRVRFAEPALLVAVVAVAVVAAQTPAPVRLLVPGAANEYVSLAASGRVVAATWAVTPASGPTDIYTAISRDGGQSFAAPVRVGAGASVNGEQPPRVALVPSRTSSPSHDVVVVWTAKAPGGGRLMSARSNDSGRSFGAARVVSGTAAPGNRGWQSMAVDAAGQPVLVWLDHREGAAAQTGTGQHHHEPPPASAAAAEASVARAAQSRLYVGSTDGSIPTQGLVHGVCYCCKTALAVSPSGALVTAWRHVYAGGFRDIAFAMSTDGGRTFSSPARVHQDGWQIAGCPENGPALAVDPSGRSHIVWPTLIRENGRETMALFHAMTTDGRTFSARTRIPAADAAFHPQLAVGRSGDLLVAWEEGSSGTRHVQLARGSVDAGGRARFATVGPAPIEPGTHPAVAVTSDGGVAAWTSRTGSESAIKVVPFP